MATKTQTVTETKAPAATSTDGEFLVKYRGKLHDLRGFAKLHPGGAELINALDKGESIDAYLDGLDGMDGHTHVHSRNAHAIMQRRAVGASQGNVDEDGIDYDKGMLWQVGGLGQQYLRWVHQTTDVHLRLFDSDFFEQFTHTAWYTILLTWIPVVCALLYISGGTLIEQSGHTVSTIALMYLGGIFYWTWMEYFLHRFVFHWQPNLDSKLQITLHFFMHGLHHKAPMDSGRLVFPPILTTIIASGVWASIRVAVASNAHANVIIAGTFTGYIGYDMIHYYLHHGMPTLGGFWHQKKAYHHAHHYSNTELGYGISNEFWDNVFSTVGGLKTQHSKST